MQKSALARLQRWFVSAMISAIVLTNVSCYNAFYGTSSKTTDAAVYEDAIKALNNLEYDRAIAYFESLGPEYLSKTEVRMNRAGALAGKCGFNFINYFTQLSTPITGSTFLGLMNQWRTTSTNANAANSDLRQYCVEAENIVKAITPTVTLRDPSQSLFLFLLGLAKMGIYLKETADPTGTGTGQWSVTLPTDGACSSTNISKAAVREIVAGLGMAFLNLTNIASVVSGANIDTAALTTACSVIVPSPCGIENASDVTDDMVKATRTLLNFSATGVVNGGFPCLDP
jgi:hypothetical protein